MAKFATGILKLLGASGKTVDDVAPTVTTIVTKQADNLPVVSNRVVSSPSVSPVVSIVARAEPAPVPVVPTVPNISFGTPSFSLVDGVLDSVGKTAGSVLESTGKVTGSVLESVTKKADSFVDAVKNISTGNKLKVVAAAGLGTAGLAYSAGLMSDDEAEGDNPGGNGGIIIPGADDGSLPGDGSIIIPGGDGEPHYIYQAGNPGIDEALGWLQTQIDDVAGVLNDLLGLLFGTGESGDDAGGLLGGGGGSFVSGTEAGTKKRTLILLLIAAGIAVITFVIIIKKKGKKGAKK